MKKVGRIMLLVVGILLIVSSVPSIISNWKALNAAGWTDISSYPEKVTYLSLIISQGVSFIFGLTAIFAFIKGKASFWLSVFSLIMIAGVIFFFINANNAGLLSDWKYVLQAILGFSLPIAYFLGSIFIRF